MIKIAIIKEGILSVKIDIVLVILSKKPFSFIAAKYPRKNESIIDINNDPNPIIKEYGNLLSISSLTGNFVINEIPQFPFKKSFYPDYILFKKTLV